MKHVIAPSQIHSRLADTAPRPTLTSHLVLLAGLFVVVEFLVLGCGLSLLLGQETVYDHLGHWFSGYARGDSWYAMRPAYQWFKDPHTKLLYDDIFFTQGIKFQYAPTSLLPFLAGDRLGIRMSNELLNYVSWISVIVEAVALAVLAVILGRRSGLVSDDWRSTSICAGIAALAGMVFFPLIKSYSLGQVQTWINATFVLACVCWLTERKALAGILIGAICLLKPQFTLFLVWGGLRREWRFLAGWAVVVVPGLILSLHAFGFANHLDYVSLLQYISRHGEAYFPNQTVNGLLNRLFDNGDNLHFQDGEFAPFHPWVYAGTLISSIALLLLALLWRVRDGSANLFDFLIAGLTFTVASPVGWHHHFGILPAVFVALFFAIAVQPRRSSRRSMFLLLGASFILAANYFTVTDRLAPTPFNFLQSYLLFGALAALWLLYRLRDKAPWMGWDPVSGTLAESASVHRA